MLPFVLGTLEPPPGWESSAQITLREPPPAPMTPVQRSGQMPPRAHANIVVTRRPAVESSARTAREAFVRDGTFGLPALTEEKSGELTGPDGVEGCWLQISFDSGRGFRLVQRHLFRLERDASLTHIVATIDEARRETLEQSLWSRLEKFRVDG